MKFSWLILVTAFLLIEAGCKKKDDQIVCPQVVSPNNYSTFHSGDTVSISVYLPPAIQRDSIYAYAEIGNDWHPGNDSARLDTIFYPTFNTDRYATIRMILKARGNGIDSDYINTGIGPGTIVCRGITIYIQP